MSSSQQNHNLNIQTYSFPEILALFNLSYDISLEDMKRAKKQVLMIHPDKSRLPADYFLFYKRAFEQVVQYFENQQKIGKTPTEENTKYKVPVPDINKNNSRHITTKINEMDKEVFHAKFNQLFEDNMMNRPNPQKNEWFSGPEPEQAFTEKVQSAGGITAAFDQMKERNAGLIVHRGIQEMRGNHGGSSLYDGEGEEDDGVYITSDPFSKLKYDDLRKVHKDQTIFAVSERDINKVQQYGSVDQYQRARGGQNLTPLQKTDAERILEQREKEVQQRMANLQHRANLKSMEYAEKNKQVLSSFLFLEGK
jgi:hypothetical protein